MSGPNGRQKRAIENLASALNECFDAAVEKSTEAAQQNRQEVNARLDRQDDTLRQHGDTLRQQGDTLRQQGDTLRQQNETLRMIWTQCGGKTNVRLPVDD